MWRSYYRLIQFSGISIVAVRLQQKIESTQGDVVIALCAYSGTTLKAARELNRNIYGFEISGEFYNKAVEQMLLSSAP